MKIRKYSLSELNRITLSGLSGTGIEDEILSCIGGTVFVCAKDDVLIGTLNVDMFDKCKKNIVEEINVNCDVVLDRGTESLEYQVLCVLAKNKYNGVIPIVDDRRVLLGGVSCTDDTWSEDLIRGLDKLCFMKEYNISLGHYFQSMKYKKVGIWGLNKLSINLAQLLSDEDGISVAGIYENSKLKIYCSENTYNTTQQIYFVDSIKELLLIKELDFVIVTDWTFRHLNALPSVKKSKINMIYFNEIVKLLPRYENDYCYLQTKKALRERGIELISACIPTEKELNIPSKKENMSQQDKINWYIKENESRPDFDVKVFGAERQKYIKNIIKNNGHLYYGDINGKYFNCVNKARIVLNAREYYENTLYIIGPCVAGGQYNADDNTLGYYLQELFNSAGAQYRVVPIGIVNDCSRYFYFKLLESVDLNPGDKVVWIDQSIRMVNHDLNLKEIFKELYIKYGNDFYYDIPIHCGKKCNEVLAKEIYNYISATAQIQNIKTDAKDLEEQLGQGAKQAIKQSGFAGNPELLKYKEYLEHEAIHKRNMVGAIVMNCNPFTLGHQYLIEYAAQQVDYLYVFIVEEDKSFFKFSDRIALVRKGTEHLKNVKVIASGQFIISSNTFSEYFDKANLKGTTIDTTLDVETFALEIAPVLDISIRFVGEEPLDPITNQYNQNMKKILPKYGIELREIPRKQSGEGVISASRVRKYMENNQWEEIEKIVPQTTFDFLVKEYKSSNE